MAGMKLHRLAVVKLHSGLACALAAQVRSECSPFFYTSQRLFSTSHSRLVESRELHKPSQPGPEKQQDHGDLINQAKEKQRRTPWHRDGANVAPVRRERSAGAMVKGKLLTTPSRLLKLIIPLTTKDHNKDRKSVEPLALAVHPQQPLSYLERLIQSELPTIKNDQGDEKIPAVHFKAESATDQEIAEDRQPEPVSEDGLDKTNIDGKIEKTGVVNPKMKHDAPADSIRGGPGEGGVETYSGEGREGASAEEKGSRFVRWSASTEIGDFIRDAARGKEFVIEVEGLEEEIRIGVPTFRDRTHYLRLRLQRAARSISEMARIKEDCDKNAHRAAQRVAIVGFAVLVLWWVGVYYLTFKTNLGWDTMEPVTYLVGLSTLMMGYLWFIYHNREVSYRAAMNMTISRRQSQLYASRGFNLERWEELLREGNALRAEIKAIASEYDVEWDEAADEQDEKVTKALKKGRDKQKKEQKEEDDEVDVEETKDDGGDKDKNEKPKSKDD
jgi:calcium uniporter protein, mitochondrial